MATNRLFTYSTTSINGASQSGNLSISTSVIDGYRWWPGPDEDIGYIIAHDDTNPNMRTEGARSATVSTNSIGFWRTSVKTDGDFLTMTNGLFNQGFVTASVAANWLLANGYWTSWSSAIVTSGLIMQLDANNSTSYPGTGTTIYDLTGTYSHTLSAHPIISGGVPATFTTLSGVKCFNENSGFIRPTPIYDEDEIELPHGPILTTSGYTYVTWARIKTSSASWRTLFKTAPVDIYLGDSLVITVTQSNHLGVIIGVGTGSGGFLDSGYDVTPIEDVWAQYSFVGDNSSGIFYINGTQVGTSVNLDNLDESSSYLWGAPGEEFGYLANLYLYDRKLTATEILQNYNALKDRFGL